MTDKLSFQSDKFQMLDQIVHDEKYPDCNRICSCIESSQLEQAADVKGKFETYIHDQTLTALIPFIISTELVNNISLGNL